NPSAAGWLNSDHALGLSVDLSFNGMNYDVGSSTPSESQIQRYELLRSVLKDAGFVRTKEWSDTRERNHFTLATYALREDGKPRDDPNGDIAQRRNLLKGRVFAQFEEIGADAGDA